MASGLERYKVNNRQYKLESNNYLIVNKSDELEVEVKTNKITNGICIYPPENLINEVFDYRLKSENKLLDSEGFNQNEIKFTQKTNALKTTSTGLFLEKHLPYILKNDRFDNSIDFDNLYIKLAEHLVQDQLVIDRQLLNLNSSKKETKEELYRRVSLAKDYIHDNYNQKIMIEDLAAIACLSKYHFLRSFRDFYKCTPYQFILKLKLEAAKKLIIKGFSFPQVSEMIGFSDPKNLRKAINKQY
ncbi:MAG: helix-turn-helix domain-containing protein [Crocinitomix sp.]|nr:helix-turn-helix domain-containing protein [Crocinitomix sp.]